LLVQAEKLVQEQALEESRRKEAATRLVLVQAAQKRQDELAREAEAARLKAEQDAKNRDEAARKALDQQRERAHEQLTAQAKTASNSKNFALAATLLGGAVALKATETGYQELAKARAQHAEAAKQKAAEEEKRRAADKLKLQETELAKVRAKLEE